MLTIAKESELPALDFATIASFTTILHKTINKTNPKRWKATPGNVSSFRIGHPVSETNPHIHRDASSESTTQHKQYGAFKKEAQTHKQTHTLRILHNWHFERIFKAWKRKFSFKQFLFFASWSLRETKSHKKDEGRFVCEQVSRSGSGCVSAGWTLRCSWIDLD